MADPNHRTILRTVFESEHTFASTMMIALTDELGNVQWFDWEPEALAAEIQDRFDAKIPQDNMDKIQALVLALTTNQFYVSLEAFIGICNSLGGDGADFQTFDPADVEEMCWAVTEVLLNDEPHEQPLNEVFSEEIRYYIGTEAAREGFKELPKPLTFAHLDSNYDKATEAMADPEMFSAYFTAGKEQAAQAQDENQQKLQALVNQISQLPLKRGDSAAWKKFSGKGLAAIDSPRVPAEAGRHRAPVLK
jgi:hypothetical protein